MNDKFLASFNAARALTQVLPESLIRTEVAALVDALHEGLHGRGTPADGRRLAQLARSVFCSDCGGLEWPSDVAKAAEWVGALTEAILAGNDLCAFFVEEDAG